MKHGASWDSNRRRSLQFSFSFVVHDKFFLKQSNFKDRTLRKCILLMFSPPPSHPLEDAFSDSFRNRKENFHRWCMKQLNHNRAWKQGFEFQKDYRSSDFKLISKLVFMRQFLGVKLVRESWRCENSVFSCRSRTWNPLWIS